MPQEKKTPLNTQGYRGTRDFYPADVRMRNAVYTQIQGVMHSFGYEEYDGPFLEPFELYAAKSSEEIVHEQLYSFKDRGDRQLAIRPEMTPTLARMIAAKYKELPKPLRWYSIPTCMRFERPQRGRLREFQQLNVDVFGGDALDEDVEIILTAIQIFRHLGALYTDFEVHISHRGLVNEFFEHSLNLENTHQPALLRLLDKKDKLPNDEFANECLKLGLTREHISKIELFLNATLETVTPLVRENSPALHALKERFNIWHAIIPPSCLKFTPAITRGFDYYTGIVFEVFDTYPENRRALLGGGRFDNLVEAFGTDPLPGVGYGVSDVALLNFMGTHNLLPNVKKQVDVVVVRFQDADRIGQLALAQHLRDFKLNVECTIADLKFGKQIAYANRIGATAVAFRGDDENKNNTFMVKWMQTGEQCSYSYDHQGFADLQKQMRVF